jgi:hypothetical protein
MSLNEINGRVSKWTALGDGMYQACGRTVHRLPQGAYTCLEGCAGPLYQAKVLQVDELIDFPDSLSWRILDEIDHFWQLGDRFSKLGFLHRRGYLFYGKQGSGKSSLIHQIVAKIVAAGNLAFFCDNPQVFVRCLEQFRKVEPERPMVCIFEDIDALIVGYGDSDLLQWLDGNHQVNKAVNPGQHELPRAARPPHHIAAAPLRPHPPDRGAGRPPAGGVLRAQAARAVAG